MKKNLIAIIVIVVVVVIGGGAYLLFNKSKTKTDNASSTKSSLSSSINNSVLITKTSSSLGQYLAEPNGTPLYTYSGDSRGVSNCTGTCLTTWPAYQDKGSTSNLPSNVGTIKRSDNNEIQYTYNGLPLYTYVGDTKGQPTGNGIQGFSLAKPIAQSSSQSPTTNNNNTGYSYTNGY